MTCAPGARQPGARHQPMKEAPGSASSTPDRGVAEAEPRAERDDNERRCDADARQAVPPARREPAGDSRCARCARCGHAHRARGETDPRRPPRDAHRRPADVRTCCFARRPAGGRTHAHRMRGGAYPHASARPSSSCPGLRRVDRGRDAVDRQRARRHAPAVGPTHPYAADAVPVRRDRAGDPARAPAPARARLAPPQHHGGHRVHRRRRQRSH